MYIDIVNINLVILKIAQFYWDLKYLRPEIQWLSIHQLSRHIHSGEVT
jgi:uncharacterized membrane protein